MKLNDWNDGADQYGRGRSVLFLGPYDCVIAEQFDGRWALLIRPKGPKHRMYRSKAAAQRGALRWLERDLAQLTALVEQLSAAGASKAK